MNIIYTINNNDNYYSLLQTSIKSYQYTNSGNIHCLYSDDVSKDKLDWLLLNGVILHRVDNPIYNDLKVKRFEDFRLEGIYKDIYLNQKWMYNEDFLKGTCARFDIPKLLSKEMDYILYVDCDIMFNNDISTIFNNKVKKLGVAIRSSFFNAGVLLMNLKEMEKDIDRFKTFFIDKQLEGISYNGGPITQGYINEFYKNDIEDIGVENNWHVFWGKYDRANIIHFCGLKPNDYLNIYNGQLENYSKYLIDNAFPQFKDGILYYIDLWKKYEKCN